MRHTSTKDQSGFTLVEVAIIAPIMILIALGIVAILITLVTSTVRPNARSILMQQEEKAFDTIESDINNSYVYINSSSSYGFLSSLPSGYSDSAYSDYSSPPSGTGVIMLQTFNQIVNPNDSSGTKIIPAFKDSSACNYQTDLSASNIVPVVVIYYVNNNTLYRRTLTYNNASPPATCGTKLAKQTCLSCSSKDISLLSADNISSMSIIYYTGVTNNTVTADPTAAKSAKISITASLQAGGDAVQYTSSLRAARLNN